MLMAHLEPELIAAYLDGRAGAGERHEIEAHCGECEECRAELLEVERIVESVPAPRRVPWAPLLAAAAVLLVVALPKRDPATAPPHREPGVSATLAPATLSPSGTVDRLEGLVWTGVMGADRYHVVLFDGAGRVAWEESTADTSIAVPSSVAAGLDAGHAWFWSVRARVGWDRWTESRLTEFRLRDAPVP